MGLGDKHPEKEGVLVAIPNLVAEIRRRIDQLRKFEEMTINASGLRVVDGVKGEDVVVDKATTDIATPES